VGYETAQTIYTRFGDLPLLTCCLAVIGIALARVRRVRIDGSRAATRSAIRPRLRVVVMGVLLACGSGTVLAGLSLRLLTSAVDRPEARPIPSLLHAPEVLLRADDASEFLQTTDDMCGPAALAYVLNTLGFDVHQRDVLPYVDVRPGGVSMAALAQAARRIGLLAWGEQQDFEALVHTRKPVIAHVGGDHYVVVLSTNADGTIDLFDPAVGYRRLAAPVFRTDWGGFTLITRFPAIGEGT
jgi:hypothetical protein